MQVSKNQRKKGRQGRLTALKLAMLSSDIAQLACGRRLPSPVAGCCAACVLRLALAIAWPQTESGVYNNLYNRSYGSMY